MATADVVAPASDDNSDLAKNGASPTLHTPDAATAVSDLQKSVQAAAGASTGPLPARETDETYLQGHVKTYSTRKGFGFITSEQLQSITGDIFVYNTHLVGRIGLIAGERVEFILFYDPQTLRPQARNVRVLEPAPSGDAAPAMEPPATAEEIEKLKKLNDEAKRKAQISGPPVPTNNQIGGGGMGAVQGMMGMGDGDNKLTSPAGNTSSGGGSAAKPSMNETIRRAQEDAEKKVRQEAALMQELSHHKDDYLYYPQAYHAPMQSDRPVPPKSLIPVGSEVTIIDFPIRELNGAKGVVKAFDDSSCRYKVEVNDAKKGPQEFLMPKDKLRIDTLTLPANAEHERQMKEKQAAAKEILTAAINGGQQPGNSSSSAPQAGTPGGQQTQSRQYGGPSPTAASPGYGTTHTLVHQPVNAAMQAQLQAQQQQQQQQAAAQAQQQAALQNAALQLAAAGKMKGALPPMISPALQMKGLVPAMYQPQLMAGPLKGKPLLAGAMGPKGFPMPGQQPGAAGKPGSPYDPANAQAMAMLYQQQKAAAAKSPMDPMAAGKQGGPLMGAIDPYGGKGPGKMKPANAASPVLAVGKPEEAPGNKGSPAVVQQVVAAPAPAPPVAAINSPKLPPPELTIEEKSGGKGTKWRVRLGAEDFKDAIVREAADMSSLETRRLLPGDTCVQAGETIRVDPGVVRMPIEPDGWVTVHARAIGGPTFLELAPEDEVESEPDYGDVPGLDVEQRIYPLPFLLRFKLVAATLEGDNPAKGLVTAKLAETRQGGRVKDKEYYKEKHERQAREGGKRGNGKKGGGRGGDRDGGAGDRDNNFQQSSSKEPQDAEQSEEQPYSSASAEHDSREVPPGKGKGENGKKGDGKKGSGKKGKARYDDREPREVYSEERRERGPIGGELHIDDGEGDNSKTNKQAAQHWEEDWNKSWKQDRAYDKRAYKEQEWWGEERTSKREHKSNWYNEQGYSTSGKKQYDRYEDYGASKYDKYGNASSGKEYYAYDKNYASPSDYKPSKRDKHGEKYSHEKEKSHSEHKSPKSGGGAVDKNGHRSGKGSDQKEYGGAEGPAPVEGRDQTDAVSTSKKHKTPEKSAEKHQEATTTAEEPASASAEQGQAVEAQSGNCTQQ